MKLHIGKKVHYDSGPNMTPLVDVVMVILIFLMLAGSFGGVEHYLVSNAGFANKGTSRTPLPPNFIPPTQVRVLVDLDPASLDASQDLPPADRLKNLRYQATVYGVVYRTYKDLHDKFVQIAKGESADDLKNTRIIISPSSQVLDRHLMDVYEAALDAGFSKIAFAAAH